MILKRILICSISFFLTAILINNSIAKSRAQLSKESERYISSTAKKKATPPSLIIKKVNSACRLISRDGEKAFYKFNGQGSTYIFNGTYIWIHTLNNATILMHPINYKLEGTSLYYFKDRKNKQVYKIMNHIVNTKGAGGVSHMDEIPGSKSVKRKISYIKACMMPGGTKVFVGCGIYNFTSNSIKGLIIH